MYFEDRIDAGSQLAQKLTVDHPENTIVLALPRGGVPLGLKISVVHSLLFDVVLAKKIVHPLQPEFAIGAIAENGDPIINTNIDVEQSWIDSDTERAKVEIQRRRKLYDQFLTKQSLNGKDIIIVDDGIATGMTMFAAIEAVKKQNPNQINVAVPIIPYDTYQQLKDLVDEVIYIEVPEQFRGAVGAYYQNFSQIPDSEVEKMIVESLD